MTILLSLHRFVNRLRMHGQGSTIVSFVDDPSKVRKEIRFLLLRLFVLLSIAFAVIGVGIVRVQSAVRKIEEQRALVQATYRRFESMTRLSHDVDAGRAALTKVQGYIAKEERLLDLVAALQKLAKDAGNTATFQVRESVSQAASDLPGYHFVTFTVTMQGTMRTFLRALDAFRRFPSLLLFDRIEFQGESGLENTNTTMTLSGRLYVQ